jgi:hypothetical protein
MPVPDEELNTIIELLADRIDAASDQHPDVVFAPVNTSPDLLVRHGFPVPPSQDLLDFFW